MTVSIAVLRFVTGAVVRGDHGNRILFSVLDGLLSQLPPGSRSASLASNKHTRTKCVSSHAKASSAQSSPVR